MLTGCTEIPKVEIEVEIPRIQIEIPKLNVGGGKLDIHIKPPTPESPPIEKPTIKPTAFGADANNDLPSLVAAEPPIIDDPPPNQPPIQPPIPDDGGVWV